MIAPMIQKMGRKMPRMNMTQCPFLRVMTPRLMSSTKYKMASPMYISPPIVAVSVPRLLAAGATRITREG